MRFRPHYLIWVCAGGDSPEMCDSQCIRDGAYCAPDPDEDIHKGYSGADVLRVRRPPHHVLEPWGGFHAIWRRGCSPIAHSRASH
jgi:hypothetical protein